MRTVWLKAILMGLLPFYRVDFPISSVPDQFTFTEHARGIEISRREISKQDREYSELIALLPAEKEGWKYDLSAYARRRMFKSSRMNINCVGTTVVVNYEDRNHEWIQLSKLMQRPCPTTTNQQESRQWRQPKPVCREIDKGGPTQGQSFREQAAYDERFGPATSIHAGKI